MFTNVSTLSNALTILSAMITPAVLISACGSLTISTANRLGRAMDRTRRLSTQFEEHILLPPETPWFDEKRAMLFSQLSWAVQRSRLLQSAMTCLYISLSIFVATSVAIGLVAVTGEHYAWMPIILGIGGAAFLFYTSLLLIAEVRVTRRAINTELNFVLQLGQQHAPKELLERQRNRHNFLRRIKRKD